LAAPRAHTPWRTLHEHVVHLACLADNGRLLIVRRVAGQYTVASG
jgi:hypothetical protein